MSVELVYRDVRYSLGVTTPLKPLPVPGPRFGKWYFQGMVFYRIIHDTLDAGYDFASRTLGEKIKIAITNEMFAARRWYFREDVNEYRVDRFSRIVFWPEDNATWLAYFISLMGLWAWGKFCTSGFGWRDSKANSLLGRLLEFFTNLGFFLRPFSLRPPGVNVYNFILTGGTLLEGAGEWKEYILFHTQDINKSPEWTTYEQDPSRVFKQYLTGHNKDKETFRVVDKGLEGGVGDIEIPNACPGGIAAIEKKYVRRFPDLPFSTTINGYPVTFVEMVFQGPKTFGRTDEDEWYLIEEMKVTGDENDRSKGGSWLDWVVYVDRKDWFGGAYLEPPAVIGWTRQE
jgi:hypothetical protein